MSLKRYECQKLTMNYRLKRIVGYNGKICVCCDPGWGCSDQRRRGKNRKFDYMTRIRPAVLYIFWDTWKSRRNKGDMRRLSEKFKNNFRTTYHRSSVTGERATVNTRQSNKSKNVVQRPDVIIKIINTKISRKNDDSHVKLLDYWVEDPMGKRPCKQWMQMYNGEWL